MRPVFWFVVVLLAASLLLVSVQLSANTLDYSRFNLGWNGTSRFFSDLNGNQGIEVTDLSALGSFRNSLLLIIAPGRTYQPGEIAEYRKYLENGNTIFLADDFGTGNGLLRGVGSSITITGSPLLSFDREYGDPGMVVVTSVKNATVPGDASRMLLNEPASVEGGESLVTSSFMSWVDRNGNGRIDSSEPLGRQTVLARDRVDGGEIIVLSDPGIFINAMYSLGGAWDNRKFITSLVTNTSPVLIDQVNSRTADDGGVSLALHAVVRDPVDNFGILAAGVLALMAAWVRRTL
jgi:hypothetical protein